MQLKMQYEDLTPEQQHKFEHQDAMEILAKVQRSSGMVGIISHLDILRTNIPTQLHVVKGHDTSVIKQ